MRGLAYLHPAFMLVVLALAIFVLRDGLAIRRARLAKRPYRSIRHRVLAKLVVALVVLGFGAGLVSMAVLRDRPVAESIHFPLAVCAMLGMGAAGVLGLRLERNLHSTVRPVHALCGAFGLLMGLAAAIAGFAILP
jgi:hypothetical protein